MTAAYERRGAGRVLTASETADSRKRIRGFWHHCEPAPGTPAARYLARRGLPWLAQHPDIRFRPDTPHPTGARLPAMVTLIWDGQGDICALHRTYLAHDGRKAAMEPVKATWGAFSGGAIRLHPPGPELLVAEGVETAASAAVLLGCPAWAAIACGNLRASMVLPPIVRRITIAADPDPPGQRAAAGAAARWREEGRIVRIAMPDTPGQDFADILQARIADGELHHG